MWAAQYYRFDEPRRWINSGGLGTMGVGLPYAMGIKLAKPESDVFCITGEGSIQMCIQELSTCLQYKTPVKIVSLNNRYLGMVRQWQQLDYGGRYSHSYMDALPDFVKLAEAYGHVGLKIEKPGDVEPALREAIRLKDRTVFLDMRTDPTENVWPMVQGGQGHLGDAAGLRGPVSALNAGDGRAALPRRAPAGAADARSASDRFTSQPSNSVAKGRRLPPPALKSAPGRTTMKHIIALLLENEPGALSRVVGAVLRPRLQHREPDRRADRGRRRCRA